MQHLLEAREQLASAACKARTLAERNKYLTLIAHINGLIFAR